MVIYSKIRVVKLTYSMNCHLGHSSLSSIGITHRNKTANRKNWKKVKLPLLLPFDSNASEDAGRKGLTVVSGRNSTTNKQTETVCHTPLTSDFATRGSDDEEKKTIEIVKDITNNLVEKASEQGTAVDRDRTEFGNISQKSFDSSDRLIATVDLKDLPTRPADSETSNLTIIDEECDTTFKYSERTTEPTFSGEDELTDAISSSLLNTPKTVIASSNDFTGSDLDEIALLISQATPNRRVIVKKKAPEISIKGFNKNCSEKLIFSGNKITHVKTDRKTMCRNYYPKNEIEI